tara:strand:+ start:1231 stop:1746 length:516 start_codon:yes stop_codon:yes gene_type:complete
MGILPSSYEVPDSGGAGLFAKLDVGENRFRVLSPPTTGYVVWTDKKPTRYKDRSDVPAGSEDVKHFWFLPVWMDGSVRFLEMAQKTVIRDLAFLDSNEDWGDLTDYDVIVRREGEGMETKYHTAPCPKKAIVKEATDSWEAMKSGYKPENLFVENGVAYIPQNKEEEALPF